MSDETKKEETKVMDTEKTSALSDEQLKDASAGGQGQQDYLTITMETVRGSGDPIDDLAGNEAEPGKRQ